jgi:hypothetical protein
VPAQLDHGGQFTALEIGFADGCSGGCINNEHGLNMGRMSGTASTLTQAARSAKCLYSQPYTPALSPFFAMNTIPAEGIQYHRLSRVGELFGG